MNNLDSMVLSKLPFNVHQPNGGYSHNTQLYNFFNKNLKFIISSREKKRVLRFIKKKSIMQPSFNFKKLKRRVMVRPSQQVRSASMTFITIANRHCMSYTMLMPWPHVGSNAIKRRLSLTRRVGKLQLRKCLHTIKSYELYIVNDFVHRSMQ